MSRVAVKNALESIIENPLTAPGTYRVGENRGKIPDEGKTYLVYRVDFGLTTPFAVGWQTNGAFRFQAVRLEVKIVAHKGSGTNHVSSIVDSITSQIISTGSIEIDSLNCLQLVNPTNEVYVGEDDMGKHIYIVEQNYRWSRREAII